MHGFEYRLWCIDQRINDRGVAIDVELCTAALAAVERSQSINAELTSEATDGAVERATQRDRLLLYIKDTFGIVFKDLTASMVDKALNDDNLPAPLRELLLLRAQASTSSTAKYKKFLGAVSSDGRLRGMFQFCGASRTGRASGKIVQLHNLPRPTMKAKDIELGIRAIKAGGAHLLFPNVMELASNAIRGAIIAPPGKKLLVPDLANIEGRVCAWLANETWKIKAFEAYDAGTGEDLYKLSYSRPFKIDPKSVTKHQRQIGKVMELMLQYAGGVGAFITGAATYRIDLENLASVALGEIPPHIVAEAQSAWEWAGRESRRYGLTRDVYVVCDALKRLWRNAHPNIVAFWQAVERGVLLAHGDPGAIYEVGKLRIRKDGSWLRIILPSERALCYPSLRIDGKKISYAGTNPYSRQWGRVYTYAGKLVENIVQGVARDVFMWGLVNAEDNHYDIVAHTHDELIAETPDTDDYTVDSLIGFMTQNIPWTTGLPLAAAGHAMYRYQKMD